MKNTKYKFLNWVVYVCLAIIPFLAWYVSGFGINASWNAMLFPYITGKNFAFRILVEIAAAAWIMLMILDKSYRPKKSIILWVYSAFVFVLLLADIFSVNSTRAFFSNFERMEGFIAHAHLFLYFLILISMFKNKVDWVKYRKIFLISNVPVVIVALLQLLGLSTFAPMKFLPALRDAIGKVFAPTQGGTQLDATLGNSTYLAIYSVFFIFLFFITYLEKRWNNKSKNNWMYVTMIILNLIVLFYTQTRGAQVGFAAGIFVTALIIVFGARKNKELKLAKNISLGIIAGILIAFMGLIAIKDTSITENSGTLNKLSKVANFANPINLFPKISQIKKELYNPESTYTDLLELTSGDNTFTSRLLNIKMSLEGFKERPLLGWGQDNYFYVFAKHNDARMYAQEPWFDRTHNVFMDWLIAGGALGLITYLGLYVAAIWVMWFSKYAKKHRGSEKDFVEKALITGLLVAYFVHNIFVFDNLISYILFFFLLAYISIRFNSKSEDVVVNKNDKQDDKSKTIIYGPVILLALGLALYFLNVKYVSANRNIIHGLVPQTKQGESPVDALGRSLNSFEKASKVGGIAKMESREQMAQNTISLLNQLRQANIPQNEEYMPIYNLVTKFVDSTKDTYKEIVDVKNPDPRSLSIYSTFLRSVNDNEEALKYGKRAYEMAPLKQTIAMEYIQELITSGDFAKANEVAKKMYESDESFEQGKLIYALTSIYVGNFEEGEKILTEDNGKMLVDESIVAAYQASNQKARIISILEKNLQIDPTDLDSTAYLIDLYIQNGQKVKAINLLDNLAKIRPDLKDQIESYKKSIK